MNIFYLNFLVIIFNDDQVVRLLRIIWNDVDGFFSVFFFSLKLSWKLFLYQSLSVNVCRWRSSYGCAFACIKHNNILYTHNKMFFFVPSHFFLLISKEINKSAWNECHHSTLQMEFTNMIYTKICNKVNLTILTPWNLHCLTIII